MGTMNIKSVIVFCLVSALLLIPSITHSKVIVVDPGQNGDEQNRGGKAFPVDFLGSELAVGADTDDMVIEVNSTKNFADTTGYRDIQIGNESKVISQVEHSTNMIQLTSDLDEQHFAGEDVTVQNFRIQAIGQPDNLPSDAKNFDTLTYTHEV